MLNFQIKTILYCGSQLEQTFNNCWWLWMFFFLLRLKYLNLWVKSIRIFLWKAEKFLWKKYSTKRYNRVLWVTRALRCFIKFKLMFMKHWKTDTIHHSLSVICMRGWSRKKRGVLSRWHLMTKMMWVGPTNAFLLFFPFVQVALSFTSIPYCISGTFRYLRLFSSFRAFTVIVVKLLTSFIFNTKTYYVLL